MAVDQPITLQTLQDAIHTLYENDPNTPATTDDEWIIRYRLILRAIGNWESEDILWNELWKTATLSSTLTAGQAVYPTGLTDMAFPASSVRLILSTGTQVRLEVINPAEADKAVQAGVRKAYFTGNVGTGFTLNLTVAPVTGESAIGASIVFDYYKAAAVPASATDTTFAAEMSNPDYIVYWVAAQKHLMDSNTNQYTVYSQLADTSMQSMRTFNELLPGNSTTQPDDVEYIRDNSSFGS